MRKRRGNRYQWGGPVRQGDMNPPPRPLGLSSMMQQQPMNLSQNSLAGIQPQRLQGLGQGLGSAPFAPPQPARRPGQGQFPASSATKRRAEPKGFQGASNPFGQRPMPGPGGQQGISFNPNANIIYRDPVTGAITDRQEAWPAQGFSAPAIHSGQIGSPQYNPELNFPDQTGTPLPQQWGPEPLWNPSAMPQRSAPVGLNRQGGPRGAFSNYDQEFLARMAAAQKDPAISPFDFAREEQRLGNPNYDVTGRVNPATGQIERPRADFGAGVAGGARPPAGITPVQRGASPKAWFSSTQRPEYLPDQEAQQFFPWARGGRVSLKTGGRIPRKKKGAKFI